MPENELNIERLESTFERQESKVEELDKVSAKKEHDELFTNQGKEKAYKRTQSAKDTIHNIIKFNLVTIGGAFSAILIARAIHLIWPVKYHWLTQSQVDFIDKMISYIIVSTIAGPLFKYVTKNMED